jgi:hypothetical protein
MGDPRLGAGGPDERRDEVQVVVVDEERRAREAVELLDGGGGERAVRLDVALTPRSLEVGVGVALELPEPVLDEPQDRVGDDRVEEPVDVWIVGDEAQPERGASSRPLAPSALDDELAVGVAHRARDPRDVVAIDERPERRDEPAGPPLCLERAVLTAPEADWPAVRDDDQRRATGHGRP